jgi:hypothetical protein
MQIMVNRQRGSLIPMFADVNSGQLPLIPVSADTNYGQSPEGITHRRVQGCKFAQTQFASRDHPSADVNHGSI